ncbi:MAG TPA: hypothetical protein VJC17_02540 [Candidatus Dojkabacteria bacterium]|nr:hypothetical protein [Candidatus Dojkabacteria bacterium]
MDLQDFFSKIKAPGFIIKYFNQDDWYLMVGKLKKLLKTEIKKSAVHSDNSTLKISGKVRIGNNCRIGDYVVIEGPVYIGDNVEIGPGVFIRPGTIISDECVIGHAAEIKNSLMMAGSKASNHCFVGDSIIGANARIGGHCELANRKFDQQDILINYKNEKLPTKLDKFGLILGEAARLGGGVITAPGTTIGKGTFVSTGLFVSGYLPPKKFVKIRQDYLITENNFAGTLHNKSKLFEN